MRTSALVTLEITPEMSPTHPLIVILKYENNALSSMHSSLTSWLDFGRRSLAVVGREIIS